PRQCAGERCAPPAAAPTSHCTVQRTNRWPRPVTRALRTEEAVAGTGRRCSAYEASVPGKSGFGPNVAQVINARRIGRWSAARGPHPQRLTPVTVGDIRNIWRHPQRARVLRMSPTGADPLPTTAGNAERPAPHKRDGPFGSNRCRQTAWAAPPDASPATEPTATASGTGDGLGSPRKVNLASAPSPSTSTNTI